MRLAGLFLALIALPAAAAETDVWESTGDWTIRIDRTNTSRCYATRVTSDGSTVEIGAAPTLDGGFFAVRNPKWTQIKAGATGQIEFDFGTARFGGEAQAKIVDGVPGAYVYFDNPAFVQEFSRRQSVKVIGSGGAQFELDLTGTSRALRGVLACQDAQPAPGKSD